MNYELAIMPVFDIPANIRRIEAHKDISLLKKAYSLIPLSCIHSSTIKKLRSQQKKCTLSKEFIDEAVLHETLFLSELINWFKKDFFKWFDKPTCKTCNISCPLASSMASFNSSIDMIEVFQCPKCSQFEYFNRYNDSKILLDTRIGRCHEHAQVFALICKTLKYDTRVIFDVTDHTWIEVYSDLQKRWIHCDPSEGIIDKPLMYEKGWNKTLSYIIAIGDTGIQEVTWRYTADHVGNKTRRDPVFDGVLMKSSNIYREQVLSSCTPTRRKYLLNRIISELVELLLIIPMEEKSYGGRQSGSREWREQRGEIGEQHSSVGRSVEYNPTNMVEEKEKRFSMWYSSNSDAYIITDFTNSNLVEHGWDSFTYSFKNIIRKQEFDWKKSYLAREINEEPGLIKWRFDVSKSGYSIVGVTVLTNFFVCENGDAKCTIKNDKNSFSFGSDKKKIHCNNLNASTDLTVEIVLSGGTGSNAWQHAQIGRQSMDEGHAVSFGVLLYLHKN